MENEEKKPNITNILSFASNTNFWVVRAEGGKFYDDFIDNNYIGIRYNKVTIADLNKLKTSSKIISEDTVKELYKQEYDPKGEKKMDRSSKQRLTQHAKQTYLFTFGMKSGDVVFVPSKHSNYFAIGFIDGDPYDESTKKINERKEHAPENGLHFAISDYVKRRKVYWISTIARNKLPSFLSWTVNAHQAIMNIKFENEGEKTRLMGMIFPLFEYSNHIYLRIHTGKGNNLNLSDWNTITTSSHSPEKIDMKANVNSPGDITFAVANTDWSLIGQVLKDLWNSTSNYHQLFLGGGIVYVLVGSDFKKEGAINWCMNTYKNLLDCIKKTKELKNDNSPAKKLDLSFKISGNAIQNKHRTNSLNNADVHHNEKQVNSTDKQK